jgi:hypothetical protein
LRRRSTFELAAVAWKRASAENEERQAFLDTLQL